ncbi:MAG: response regulator [Erysipelotrichaceae bacterium]|nr:response regulator [Erysipelotrichaceae bacterium]
MAREYALIETVNGKETITGKTPVFSSDRVNEKIVLDDGRQIWICGEETNDEDLKTRLDEALAANASKEIFLNNMSHDIRTPMNAIIGMTALARKHIDEKSRVMDSLNKIETASGHLLGLINEVLDMSRINSGKMVIAKEPFFLGDLLHEVLVIAGPQARDKHHTFDFSVHDIIKEKLLGDSVRLRQIMINIINNAIKYTEDNGHICVTVYEEMKDDRCILNFICEDNGIGMSKEFLEHIFDPFERANSTTISRIEGTGLGMSIVKKLIEAMNGSISIDSELKKGSIVRIQIPLEYEELSISTNDLKNKRILILENRDDILDTYRSYLEEIPVQYDHIRTHGELIGALTDSSYKGENYAAVMLGHTESGNIFDIASYIHRSDPELPVILISEDNWEEISYRAGRNGISHFIPLPAFEKTLIMGLSEAIAGSGPADDKGGEPDLSGRKILLVEDNMINREIAKEILSVTGANIETAEEGKTALKMFEESEPFHYDLILMDIQMPLMDGYEASSRIRALDREDAKKIKIFAMTANTFAEDVAKARRAGMDGHIAKPIDVNKLMNTLRQLF